MPPRCARVASELGHLLQSEGRTAEWDLAVEECVPRPRKNQTARQKRLRKAKQLLRLLDDFKVDCGDPRITLASLMRPRAKEAAAPMAPKVTRAKINSIHKIMRLMQQHQKQALHLGGRTYAWNDRDLPYALEDTLLEELREIETAYSLLPGTN